MRTLTASVLLLACAFASGCGKPGIETAPISGTVTFIGEPIKQGTINFLPASGSRPASGTIIDGQIIGVTTLQPGDGAPLGRCVITISALDTSGGMQAKPKSLIPERYARDNTSGLEYEIKRGANTVTLDLQK